jgi:hypothetical protein
MPQESPTAKEQLALAVSDARVGSKGPGSDPGPGRRPGSGAAGAPAGRAALPRAAGFWLVAAVLFLLLFASGAASPLYAVYQAQWRFSATTLTAVFGVYALVLLVTLLVFGSVSDYLGRRGLQPSRSQQCARADVSDDRHIAARAALRLACRRYRLCRGLHRVGQAGGSALAGGR